LFAVTIFVTAFLVSARFGRVRFWFEHTFGLVVARGLLVARGLVVARGLLVARGLVVARGLLVWCGLVVARGLLVALGHATYVWCLCVMLVRGVCTTGLLLVGSLNLKTRIIIMFS